MKQSKIFSILALVFGILGVATSCFVVGIIFDILAVVFGIIALIKNQSKVMAIIGLSTGIIGIVIAVAMIIYAINLPPSEKTVSEKSSEISSEIVVEEKSEYITESSEEIEEQSESVKEEPKEEAKGEDNSKEQDRTENVSEKTTEEIKEEEKTEKKPEEIDYGYEVLNSFIAEFNKNSDVSLVYSEDFIPSEKSSDHYRTEFRLAAYADSIGKSFSFEDARVDFIISKKNSGVYIDRIYLDGGTLELCKKMIEYAAPLRDENISAADIKDTLEYIDKRKEANGYYLGDIAVLLLGNDTKGYSLMLD